jgi:hypothetical protein
MSGPSTAPAPSPELHAVLERGLPASEEPAPAASPRPRRAAQRSRRRARLAVKVGVSVTVAAASLSTAAAAGVLPEKVERAVAGRRGEGEPPSTCRTPTGRARPTLAMRVM